VAITAQTAARALPCLTICAVPPSLGGVGEAQSPVKRDELSPFAGEVVQWEGCFLRLAVSNNGRDTVYLYDSGWQLVHEYSC
jgi:hypothetical protein